MCDFIFKHIAIKKIILLIFFLAYMSYATVVRLKPKCLRFRGFYIMLNYYCSQKFKPLKFRSSNNMLDYHCSQKFKLLESEFNMINKTWERKRDKILSTSTSSYDPTLMSFKILKECASKLEPRMKYIWVCLKNGKVKNKLLAH